MKEMQKWAGIIIGTVVLSALLIGCSSNHSNSEKAKVPSETPIVEDTSSSTETKAENPSSGIQFSEQGKTEKKENSIPFRIRKDYYLGWVDNAGEKPTIKVISREGLRQVNAKNETAKVKNDTHISFGFQWGSLDNDGTNRFFIEEDYANSYIAKTYIYRIEGDEYELITERYMINGECFASSGSSAAALCPDSETKEKSLYWFHDGEEVLLGTNLFRADIVFSPDGKTILYSLRDDSASYIWSLRILFSDGSGWEIDRSEALHGLLPVAVADKGKFIYWWDSSSGIIYVQQGNDTGSRRPLAVYDGGFYPRASDLWMAGWKEPEISDARWMSIRLLGNIFSADKTQMIYWQGEGQNIQSMSTYYSEDGKRGELLFSAPAMPVLPPNIIYNNNTIGVMSGKGLLCGSDMNFGITSLKNVVYQCGGTSGGTCDLYWVGDDWKTSLLESGAEFESLHISGDGRWLHYVKDKKLYVIDLASTSKDARLLAKDVYVGEYPYFKVSYDGSVALYFDSLGNAYSVDNQGQEKYINSWNLKEYSLKTVFEFQVAAVGDHALLCAYDNKLYYADGENNRVVLETAGSISAVTDYYGAFVLIRFTEDSSLVSHSTDGLNFLELSLE